MLDAGLVVVGVLLGPLGQLDRFPRQLLVRDHVSRCEIALSRARFLSSDGTMNQGAKPVSVASSISSRARE